MCYRTLHINDNTTLTVDLSETNTQMNTARRYIMDSTAPSEIIWQRWQTGVMKGFKFTASKSNKKLSYRRETVLQPV